MIVASGRERRRDFSEETGDDYTDSVVGRLPRDRSPHSTFATLGLAVLAAVVIAIALAIPNLRDTGAIYATVT